MYTIVYVFLKDILGPTLGFFLFGAYPYFCAIELQYFSLPLLFRRYFYYTVKIYLYVAAVRACSLKTFNTNVFLILSKFTKITSY